MEKRLPSLLLFVGLVLLHAASGLYWVAVASLEPAPPTVGEPGAAIRFCVVHPGNANCGPERLGSGVTAVVTGMVVIWLCLMLSVAAITFWARWQQKR